MSRLRKHYCTRAVLIELSESPWHHGHCIYPNGRDGTVVVSHAHTLHGLMRAVKAAGVERERVPHFREEPQCATTHENEV